MTREEITFWFNFTYVTGLLLWVALWILIKGHIAMKKNRLLWVPFLFCIFNFLAQIALWFRQVHTVDFNVEQTLVRVVEENTNQLVQAIIGTLIIAPIIIALRQGKSISHEFVVFQSLALGFLVVGVLPIYWIPDNEIDWLFLLRHVKTVPYTFSICYFLGGVLILLAELTNEP